jgi:hypothetical protein
MGNEVEARTKRVRNHLQRPDHPDRQLTNAKVGSTVNRTAPATAQQAEAVVNGHLEVPVFGQVKSPLRCG